MSEKEYEIWTEGWAANGDGLQKAHFWGTYEGKTFKDAVMAAVEDKYGLDDDYWNEERLTFYGCKFYDNEADAREFLG